MSIRKQHKVISVGRINLRKGQKLPVEDIKAIIKNVPNSSSWFTLDSKEENIIVITQDKTFDLIEYES